ncbi:MAG: 4Fe-4S dicluster-binding protein [Candidatus Thalassarchaeaceae archaeon]|jgi:ferredoxin
MGAMKLTIINSSLVNRCKEEHEVTEKSDLAARRNAEQKRIRMMLNAMRSEERAKIKGGLDTVAWVKEELCIGCDQCTIVCDDDAIEVYRTPMKSPMMDVDNNKKARILREPCTGCKICVLACPTDAIIMIDR